MSGAVGPRNELIPAKYGSCTGPNTAFGDCVSSWPGRPVGHSQACACLHHRRTMVVLCGSSVSIYYSNWARFKGDQGRRLPMCRRGSILGRANGEDGLRGNNRKRAHPMQLLHATCRSQAAGDFIVTVLFQVDGCCQFCLHSLCVHGLYLVTSNKPKQGMPSLPFLIQLPPLASSSSRLKL
jgi:hypothetical protein